MDTQGLILIIAAIPNLIIGSFIWLRDVRDKINIFFALFALSASCWSLGLAGYIFTHDLDTAYLWAQFYYSAAALIGVSFAYFCMYYVSGSKRFSSGQLLALVPPLFLIAMIIWKPDFLLEQVVVRSWGKEVILDRLGYFWYTVYFVSYVAYGFTVILKKLLHTKGVQQTNLKLIFGGFIVAFSLGATFNLILPFLGNYKYIWIGPPFTIAYIAFISYAIAKHGLFGIRVAVVRSMAYILTLLVLGGVYYISAYAISIAILGGSKEATFITNPINILLALALAFIFQPIKQFFDKITDNIFFRDRYDSDEFYARLSEVLTSTTNLRGLLQRASREIGGTLKAEQAFFYVQYNHAHHVSAGTKGHSLLPLEDGHALNEYVKKNGNEIIITDLMERDAGIRKLLVSHKIAILMPLTKQGAVLGYLALGDQQASGYTNRDVKVLSTVSDELIIAIQNALSVQIIRDINDHLEQRIKAATQELKASNTRLKKLDATKDEFVSMASHQLRTPLTSIKGYLSMVLEGDVGKISAAQRKVLAEAFDSSERMVRLIHDFLNVSRLQTGKFSIEYTTYDIVKLIDEEVRTLQSTAEKRNITMEVNKNVKALDLTLDETKMRQVVMNFIDNALYYSKEGTTVDIELKEKDGVLTFQVTDTGIGVPKDERDQLFMKFYRASNARVHRPDGTGVGLYLAKKVITAHGGSVLYEPHEQGGSTFGFKIPLTNN